MSWMQNACLVPPEPLFLNLSPMNPGIVILEYARAISMAILSLGLRLLHMKELSQVIRSFTTLFEKKIGIVWTE